MILFSKLPTVPKNSICVNLGHKVDTVLSMDVEFMFYIKLT
jgi:hypothetical protein